MHNRSDLDTTPTATALRTRPPLTRSHEESQGHQRREDPQDEPGPEPPTAEPEAIEARTHGLQTLRLGWDCRSGLEHVHTWGFQ